MVVNVDMVVAVVVDVDMVVNDIRIITSKYNVL